MAQLIRFASGSLNSIDEVVAELGCHRVLILASDRHGDATTRVRNRLGPAVVGRFAGARMHTPVEVTEAALTHAQYLEADAVLAIGGGSTTGLAKALAVRSPVRQIIVPTTYAGSEVTPVLGETVSGVKQTRRERRILPDAVVYDPDLTMALPWAVTVTSAFNAMAHPVVALNSPDHIDAPSADAASPTRAIELLLGGLRALARDRDSRSARADLLRGAWYAGLAFASGPTGLHHRVCHVLGGRFGLAHSSTHTVMLPQVLAFTAPVSAGPQASLAKILGVAQAPGGMFDLVAEFGGPTALEQLGMRESDLPEAAGLAAESAYPNATAQQVEDLLGLLLGAWHGTRP